MSRHTHTGFKSSRRLPLALRLAWACRPTSPFAASVRLVPECALGECRCPLAFSSASTQSRHVFDENPPWAHLSDDPGELSPEPATLSCLKARPLPGCRDVLAGKSPADEVDGLKVVGS